jgi:hypothetical protein
LTSTRREGLVIYVAAWAVVLPVQSVIVGVFSDDLAPLYFLFNVQLGARLRESRRHRQLACASAWGSAPERSRPVRPTTAVGA